MRWLILAMIVCIIGYAYAHRRRKEHSIDLRALREDRLKWQNAKWN